MADVVIKPSSHAMHANAQWLILLSAHAPLGSSSLTRNHPYQFRPSLILFSTTFHILSSPFIIIMPFRFCIAKMTHDVVETDKQANAIPSIRPGTPPIKLETGAEEGRLGAMLLP
jgi:hypothetical protein